MKRRLFYATLAFIGMTAVIILGDRARAAALLDMNGQKIVVLTGDEFVKAMKAKDDEIAELKTKLADKAKAECNLI